MSEFFDFDTYHADAGYESTGFQPGIADDNELFGGLPVGTLDPQPGAVESKTSLGDIDDIFEGEPGFSSYTEFSTPEFKPESKFLESSNLPYHDAEAERPSLNCKAQPINGLVKTVCPQDLFGGAQHLSSDISAAGQWNRHNINGLAIDTSLVSFNLAFSCLQSVTYVQIPSLEKQTSCPQTASSTYSPQVTPVSFVAQPTNDIC